MLVHGRLFFVGTRKILTYQQLTMFIRERTNFGMLFEMIWETIYRNRHKGIFLSTLASVVNI